ncbi:TPA: HAD family hydrolase [Streptococcus suis]
MMNRTITTIIFDLDNTLFNFNDYWESAHHETFNQFKYDSLFQIDYDDFIDKYRYFDKLLWEELLQKRVELDELRIKRLIYTLNHFGIEIDREHASKFFNTFFQLLLKGIHPNYQLIEKLKNLKKKYTVCILTNGKSDEQLEKIKRCKFYDLLPYYISDDIGYEKPDEEAFWFVLNKLGSTPSETLMVGDSVTNDIFPAAKLGLQTCYIGKEHSNSADYAFKNIEEAIDEFIGKEEIQ